MQRKHNPRLVPYAKQLRKNMTKEERHLWYDFLRTYSVPFVRQKVFINYIVDFYCAKAKLVIEIDGSQHYDEEAKQKDICRDEFLNSYGLTVLRIPNKEINHNFAGVCEHIDRLTKTLIG